MVNRIGMTAGRVWQLLREREEADTRRLPKMLSERPIVVSQALGWLAREGKLVIDDKAMTIKLK